MARSKTEVAIQSELFPRDLSSDATAPPRKSRPDPAAADLLCDSSVPLAATCRGACTETFLPDRAVAARYAITRATVWRWVTNDPDFPRPIRLSRGTTRWRTSDLVAFDARQSADRTRGAEPKSGGATR